MEGKSAPRTVKLFLPNRTMENTSGGNMTRDNGNGEKCAFTVTGNCEDCSLPVGEDCPHVNDDEDVDDEPD